MSDPTLLIDRSVKKIEYIFRVTGNNITVGKKTPRDKYRCWFMYIFNLLWLNSDLAGAFVAFFAIIRQRKNLIQLTYIAPCVIFSYVGNAKTLYLVVNEQTIMQLINIIRKFEIDQRNRPEDLEADAIIQEEETFLSRVMRVLNIFYIFLLICFASTPLLIVLLKYLATNEVELRLPFYISYPFDAFDLRFYPFVYLRQIWTEIIVVFGICAADFMLYIFCVYLRTQFRLLQHYFEKVIPPESQSGVLHDKDEVREKLVELIDWHQKLISSVDLLETIYTRSTLVNFVASSTLICLTGFNVVAIDDSAFVIPFLNFMLTCLLQIFFLCFFSNLLMESVIYIGAQPFLLAQVVITSMAVSDAIYNSKWYSAHPLLRKTLFLIQIRAQTPCKLTASKFTDVNLKAFMKICSTAWSYFALLQTLYSSQ